jgi:hypothetical protein
MTVDMQVIQVFWKMVLYCWVSGYQHFEGLWHLYLDGLSSPRRMVNVDVRSFLTENMNILG